MLIRLQSLSEEHTNSVIRGTNIFIRDRFILILFKLQLYPNVPKIVLKSYFTFILRAYIICSIAYWPHKLAYSYYVPTSAILFFSCINLIINKKKYWTLRAKQKFKWYNLNWFVFASTIFLTGYQLARLWWVQC